MGRDYHHNMPFDSYDDDDPTHEERPPLKCKRCGSTDVRWRMQGGAWTLFSLQPGVLHKCANPSASEDFK